MARRIVNCWRGEKLLASYEVMHGGYQGPSWKPPEEADYIRLAMENLTQDGRAAHPFEDVVFEVEKA